MPAFLGASRRRTFAPSIALSWRWPFWLFRFAGWHACLIRLVQRAPLRTRWSVRRPLALLHWVVTQARLANVEHALAANARACSVIEAKADRSPFAIGGEPSLRIALGPTFPGLAFGASFWSFSNRRWGRRGALITELRHLLSQALFLGRSVSLLGLSSLTAYPVQGGPGSSRLPFVLTGAKE